MIRPIYKEKAYHLLSSGFFQAIETVHAPIFEVQSIRSDAVGAERLGGGTILIALDGYDAALLVDEDVAGAREPAVAEAHEVGVGGALGLAQVGAGAARPAAAVDVPVRRDAVEADRGVLVEGRVATAAAARRRRHVVADNGVATAVVAVMHPDVDGGGGADEGSAEDLGSQHLEYGDDQ